MKSRASRSGGTERGKAVSKERPAVKQCFRISRWERVHVWGRHAYNVASDHHEHGILVVGPDEAKPAVSQGRRQPMLLQVFDYHGTPTATLRCDAISLPVELQKAIAQERVRRFAAGTLYGIFSDLGLASPELIVACRCYDLLQGYDGVTMQCLQDELSQYRDDLALDSDASLSEANAIKVECELLWQDRLTCGDDDTARINALFNPKRSRRPGTGAANRLEGTTRHKQR
jgi:hypothetical protein